MPSYTWTLPTPAPATAGSSATATQTLQTAIAELPTDYGTDITTWAGPDQTEPDLDPTFTMISGPRVVAEAFARRLGMAHDTLPDDRDAGYDLRRVVNGKWTSARAFKIRNAIYREALKDPRIYDAKIKLSYVASTRTLTVETELDTYLGTFALVLEVTSVTVTILRAA